MLFAHAFDSPNLRGWIRRFRKRPLRVYGSALGLVTAATLVRLGLHQELSSASPFTAYSLPVLCMALAGGFYPGMVTLAASLVTGSILFLPPVFSFTLAEGAEWPLLMFAVVGGIQVILVSGLIAAILLHDEHQQFSLRRAASPVSEPVCDPQGDRFSDIDGKPNAWGGKAGTGNAAGLAGTYSRDARRQRVDRSAARSNHLGRADQLCQSS